MELTVLGRYAPFPPAGGGTPGYLVRSGDTSVLIEGGHGVLSRLQEFMPAGHLSAVVASHLHPDHIADLHAVQFAIFTALRDGRRRDPLPVYAPNEPGWLREWLKGVVDGWIDLRPLPVDTGLTIGPLRFTFTPTHHPLPCWAMRVTDGAGTLFYSADTGPEALASLAAAGRGSDVAIIESSLLEEHGDFGRLVGHLKASEAAALGRNLQAGRTLLTHFHPEIPVDQYLAEARQVWPGVEAADERRTYSITSSGGRNRSNPGP